MCSKHYNIWVSLIPKQVKILQVHSWLLISVMVIVWISPCLATPGPDSTLLVINRRSEESVRIAQAYVESRFIPKDLQCEIEVDPVVTINHELFYNQIVLPILNCVDRYPERIEAIVLTRGTPLRVLINSEAFSSPSPPLTLSSASLLSVAQSRLAGSSLASPQNASEYAEVISCTNNMPCWSPKILNPWRFGHFSPRWFEINQGIQWAPLWVSRLDADSEENTLALIGRAVASDQEYSDEQLPTEGITVLMAGADPARAALDFEYDALALALQELGDEVLQVPFDRDYSTEQTISALITGSAQLGQVIEGNTYVPGAIIDNLTSFGAHPHNFDPNQAEVQASISRWIASGASGAHGTTDEPLNNSFPSRAFLLDYRKGASLVEAFSRHIPFLAWQNVIIGDPMMAPYMQRPKLEFEYEADGKTRFTIEMQTNQRLISLSLWNSESLIAQLYGEEELIFCPEESQQVLAVAQLAPREAEVITEVDPEIFGDGFVGDYAKGWRLFTLDACDAQHTTQSDMSPTADMAPLDISFQDLDQGLDQQGIESDQMLSTEFDASLSSEPTSQFSPESGQSHHHNGCEQSQRSFPFNLLILILFLIMRKLSHQKQN